MAKLRGENEEKIKEKRKLINSGSEKAAKKAKTELASLFEDFSKTAKESAEAMADSASKKIKSKAVQDCPDKESNPYGTKLPREGKKGNWLGNRGNSIFKLFSGKEIEFIKGYPDFSPFVYKSESGVTGEVQITMTGVNDTDFRNANAAMAEKLGEKEFKQPEGYVWHHKEDGVTMQLVPKDVNNPAEGGVSHSGGASVARKSKEY